ncbi:hypothetical protein EHI8A_152080 [Entamoeba histolytica HM-1:IMSS-B]|uniref:Uncharacterized protein n=6 Tax=Entamoeba histolytica TaxID=5759 RepID=C4LZ07_ENTH1|nr:hypothetical protein EHI_118250 [Entamoeba histolytica HM-1:IMSS]EMD47700.1 Hypothetical protein EHI5A_114300 [Entamoeba histolytica KU27]EMH74096.1 hypothetical protein EHI8A_152080 [Entamoeba histolytica HM-1:IMSS-B]EMS13621.1 hypothetical protein KM1_227180 [Entamoeba histolytica HM-3:IMSS]ENY64326.1 hypothetical protein EHI7A_135630 [Entamoeba histolytica HM-1:IMSS-A]GAT94075.1 hypothetical protein CL6EHI_118250 [Entamoeba histolytica]|eukprot:XP_656031.1 hypothetical protein EHI_118250 [Entamoeba histolytica HM-1:IMSS]
MVLVLNFLYEITKLNEENNTKEDDSVSTSVWVVMSCIIVSFFVILLFNIVFFVIKNCFLNEPSIIEDEENKQIKIMELETNQMMAPISPMKIETPSNFSKAITPSRLPSRPTSRISQNSVKQISKSSTPSQLSTTHLHQIYQDTKETQKSSSSSSSPISSISRSETQNN